MCQAWSQVNDDCTCGRQKRAGYERCRSCVISEAASRTEKLCHGCGEIKSAKEFGVRPGGPGKASKRLRSRCRACEVRAQAARRKANPEAVREYKRRRASEVKGTDRAIRSAMRRSARSLNLDPFLVLERYDVVGNVCEACGEGPKGTRVRVSIDHRHSDGQFRGLLCNNCNLALGHLEDSPEKIRHLLSYVERDIK